jgi:hypothetical protein
MTGCNSKPVKVDHHFSFDYNPKVEVLNYQYGDPAHGDHAPEWQLAKGHISQGTSIHGHIYLADYLYVKWRVLPDGPVYEDRVDLKRKLPSDMTDQHVYFFIEGPQLNIYLISPENADPPFRASQDEIRRLLTTGVADDNVKAKYGNKKIFKIYPAIN